MTDQSEKSETTPIHPLDAKRAAGPDCVSQEYPDPLVNDCDDILREETSQELERKRAGLDPEPKPDWKVKAKNEIKAGLEQIRDALHEAYREGKNDPKIKQFSDDVRDAIRIIGDDINDLFD